MSTGIKYSVEYDAYYYADTGEWIDPKCCDVECMYCNERPCVATNDTSQERVDEIQKQRHEQAQKQEPVAEVIDWGIEGPRLRGLTNDWPRVGTLLYTTPPQRQPLTDEQVWDAYMEISAEFDCNVIDLVEFARAIEAAHGIKEKNT